MLLKATLDTTIIDYCINFAAVSRQDAVPDRSAVITRPLIDAQQALSVITSVEDPMLRSCMVSSCSLDLYSSSPYV